MVYVWLIIGATLLLAGGELLVRHSSRLALLVGLSPLVVGLTVVAFGTSAPELITSVYGRLQGENGVAFGNVVGSNIFNVLLILGLSALCAPLRVDSKVVRWKLPFVVVGSVVVLGFAWSGGLGRLESGTLFVALVAFTIWTIAKGAHDEATATSSDLPAVPAEDAGSHWSISLVLLVVGLGLLIGGGRLFVQGAVATAEAWGVSDSVVGLTVVAAGTSLPELVTSLLAALRGQGDIAIGNVVGSNFFNLTGVLGLAGLVGTGELTVASSILEFDLLVMLATSVVCLPVMATNRSIDRWEGVVLMLYYVGYTGYLVLGATGRIPAPGVVETLLGFVLPLTGIALVAAYRTTGAQDGHP